MSYLEWKILRKIYPAINENGIWRRHYNFALHQVYNIVKHFKIMRLRWGHHDVRAPEATTVCKIFDRRGPVGQRGVERPRLRYSDDVESDIKTLGVRILRRRLQIRPQMLMMGCIASYILNSAYVLL